jgi:hypothetical protein
MATTTINSAARSSATCPHSSINATTMGRRRAGRRGADLAGVVRMVRRRAMDLGEAVRAAAGVPMTVRVAPMAAVHRLQSRRRLNQQRPQRTTLLEPTFNLARSRRRFTPQGRSGTGPYLNQPRASCLRLSGLAGATNGPILPVLRPIGAA